AGRDRGVRGPPGEHEEERHVPLVDEEGEVVEARRELGVLDVVDRQDVERLADGERGKQEGGADAEPVEVGAAPRLHACEGYARHPTEATHPFYCVRGLARRRRGVVPEPPPTPERIFPWVSSPPPAPSSASSRPRPRRSIATRWRAPSRGAYSATST